MATVECSVEIEMVEEYDQNELDRVKREQRIRNDESLEEFWEEELRDEFDGGSGVEVSTEVTIER